MNIMAIAHKQVKALLAKMTLSARYRGQYAAMMKVALKHVWSVFKKQESKFIFEIRDFGTCTYKKIDIRTLPSFNVNTMLDEVNSWTIKGNYKTEEGTYEELTSGFHHTTFERNLQYWNDNQFQFKNVNFLVLVDDVPYRLTF